MRKIPRSLLFAVIAMALACIAFAATNEPAKKDKPKAKEDIYTQVELFADAVSIVKSDYVDEVEPKKLMYGALKGMLSSLDDYSQFMDQEDFKEIKVETKGEFGGVGIEITMKDGILTIIAPIAATPADAAGIKPGDKIVKIDDKVTKNMSLSDAVKMLRGDPGSKLVLTIWREKDQKILTIPIKRAIIKVNSIKKPSLIEDKIGYIKLIEFQENTGKDLGDALKKLESEGMDSLILDLRNNPGGLLDTSVDVAEYFLPKDSVIVSIKSRTPGQNVVFKSSGKNYKKDFPLIILANEGSASASEIVSGAIQDNKRGIILGAKTFGKASVQTVIPLKDGSALRLTTALYYTPSGKMIRNQGITPDVVVEREDAELKKKVESADIFEKLEESKEPKEQKEQQAAAEKEKLQKKEDVERDNQLRTAINLMKAIKVYKAK
jgi:carboxyl-terminal processing protease